MILQPFYRQVQNLNQLHFLKGKFLHENHLLLEHDRKIHRQVFVVLDYLIRLIKKK
jgi:hypothetical protein